MAVTASGKTREQFFRDARQYDTGGVFETALGDMVTRRIGGEPLAYITGEWEFYGLPLNITRDVMVPRIDTEVLTTAAIAWARRRGASRALDLCAGSGCVGLAIAASVPSCRVVLADNSQKALSVARLNILRNALTRTVTNIELDALRPPPPLLGSFDLIVSNPPYIPRGDIAALDPSVRDYEPHAALDGGLDGLDFYRRIASGWTSVLNGGGLLAFECGIGQSEAVQDILASADFGDITAYRDTLGIERVITGIKQG